ncbi:MAG: ABC transporter substrate-binding protein [Clostridia bacterium]|nr:ABC transporter substrate-binding protein [Clostridia bacterium]
MKIRRISAMLLTFVLLFSVALGTSGARMSSALAEDGTAEEQVLVFKTDGYQKGFGDYELAEAFNKTHPGKKIVVEPVLKGEALATELMSGKADYILNTSDTSLDASKGAASGLFVDLYEWMDGDPDFHREDYFENLFEAMEYDGHLYGILGHFYMTVIFLNRPMVEALGVSYEPLDSINVVEILDLYDAAKAQGLMTEDTPLVFEDAAPKNCLLEMEFNSYVDLTAKTSHFSDPAYIELLERVRGTYSERRVSEGATISNEPDRSPFGEAILAQSTSSLFLEMIAMMQPAQGHPLGQPHEALMGPLVFESISGKAFAGGSQLFMVPKSCSNPELAWEFIKFCIAPLDEENGEDPNTAFYKAGQGKFFPISRANLKAFAEYRQISGNADFDACLAKLEARIEEIRELHVYTLNASIVIYPLHEQYFDYGTITAEECAKQMDDRLYLYLNE